jgi:hypothetical protein
MMFDIARRIRIITASKRKKHTSSISTACPTRTNNLSLTKLDFSSTSYCWRLVKLVQFYYYVSRECTSLYSTVGFT